MAEQKDSKDTEDHGFTIINDDQIRPWYSREKNLEWIRLGRLPYLGGRLAGSCLGSGVRGLHVCDSVDVDMLAEYAPEIEYLVAAKCYNSSGAVPHRGLRCLGLTSSSFMRYAALPELTALLAVFPEDYRANMCNYGDRVSSIPKPKYVGGYLDAAILYERSERVFSDVVMLDVVVDAERFGATTWLKLDVFKMLSGLKQLKWARIRLLDGQEGFGRGGVLPDPNVLPDSLRVLEVQTDAEGASSFVRGNAESSKRLAEAIFAELRLDLEGVGRVRRILDASYAENGRWLCEA